MPPLPRHSRALTLAATALLLLTPVTPTGAEVAAPTPATSDSLTMGVRPDRADPHAVPPAPAEFPWPLPQDASRVPASWDFEDRITPEGIIIPFPRGWFSGNPGGAEAPREGFPFYNEPGYSTDTARSGRYSFKLPTRGGSTSTILAAGRLPSMPGADYIAVAHVRTDSLRHARARLIARFSDADPQDPSVYTPVLATEQASPAVISNDQWTELRVHLPYRGVPSYLQLELQLLQPAQMLNGPPRRHESLAEDVRGAAYFDDVAIYQVPRLSINTNSPVNMVEAPDRVELNADVRDLTGEPLHARIWVWDMRGNLVDTHDFPVSRTASARAFTPDLPSYGWYRATLGVRNERVAVGVKSVDFAWFSPNSEGFSRDPTRFGVIVEDLDPGELALLPDAVEALRVGAAAVSAWGGTDAAAGSVFDLAMDAILSEQVELTFILESAPRELAHAAKLDPGEVLAMLASDPANWLDSLTPLLSVYGEQVLRWQIGSTDADEAVLTARGVGDTLGRSGDEAVGDMDLRERLDEAAAAIRELVPSARLVLPWPADHSLAPIEGQRDAALSALMRVGPGFAAESVGGFVDSWPDEIDTAASLEPIDGAVYGRAASAEDLAKRAILAWEAGIERISVVKPWVWRADAQGSGAVGVEADAPGVSGAVMPTPAASVWRTLASALAGHEANGRLPATEGTTVILGTPAGDEATGVVVGWSDRNGDAGGELRAYLGAGDIRATDLFGNDVAVRMDGDEHVIALGGLPVIVKGVDPALLKFWSTMRFEPALIPSRAELREIELVMTNPWPQRITGAIRLASPASWNFEPRVVPIGIDAGETARVPLSVRLGVGEETGERVVLAEMLVEAGLDRYGPIEVPITTELGLEGVAMSSNYRITRGPAGRLDRVVVSVLVTNEGDTPLTLEAFVRAPGHRSENAPISELMPGESEATNFVFDDPRGTIIGGFVRTGVRELGGTGRLNKTVRVSRLAP